MIVSSVFNLLHSKKKHCCGRVTVTGVTEVCSLVNKFISLTSMFGLRVDGESLMKWANLLS